MKKLGLLALAIATSLIVNGQNDTPQSPAPAPPTTPNTNKDNQNVRLGLAFSPVISWYSASGDAGTVEPEGTRFNISFGLNIDLRIAQNNNYFFSTGLFLLNTGGSLSHKAFIEETDGSFSLTQRESDFRTNYVNIPLTVLLRTNEIGYMRYFGRVGFDAGVNTKSTYDFRDIRENSEDTRVVSVEDEDASDLTALFRFGLRFEAGFEYNIGGATHLYFSASYNHGLNNVFTDDYRLPETNSTTGELIINSESAMPEMGRRVKANNNLFMITAGVYF